MACTSCNACNARSACGCTSCNAVNTVNTTNSCCGGVAGITFPDFVANACCNPCCTTDGANYVTTGSCGCAACGARSSCGCG